MIAHFSGSRKGQFSVTDTPTSFGESLRLARVKRGWTQQEVADHLAGLGEGYRVRRQTVALWEDDESAPMPLKMKGLKLLFGNDLQAPEPPVAAAALAYWRGRVDQIAKAMESVLAQQLELSRDMGGTATPVSEDEDPKIQAALADYVKRGRKPGTTGAKRKAK